MIQGAVFLGLKMFDEVLPRVGSLKPLQARPTLIWT